jgi:23S rRNA (cytosine1962-C5)-methyltransferase
MARASSAATAETTIKVSRRAAARLRNGHPWVYRSDVLTPDSAPSGALVRTVDELGRFYGMGLHSSSSQIALRMISGEELSGDALHVLIAQRIKKAIAYRERLKVPRTSNAWRIVFSEGDQLPGLMVDRYNDVITVQFLTQAMDREDVRGTVLQTLVAELAPAGIVERVDARIRELEALPAIQAGLLHGDKSQTVMEMNGLKFVYDALSGQKTGAFLDQRENYAAAEVYAQGRALDVFCYQGGFALHLARVCDEVTGVDASRPALEAAEQNIRLNSAGLRVQPEWIEGNAFDLLRDYSDAGERYDTIVLDPPAFAKTRRAVATALNGYKEINLRALKMLNPGGVLITCSCSLHVSPADFLQTIRAATADARRQLRIVELRGQSRDHPILAAVPETAYLKCVIAITI